MFFADGSGEKSGGKGTVGGRFFGSNRAKRPGFEAIKRSFTGFMFTDKHIIAVSHVVDFVLFE
jgi:hypothetical protein